jgi:large subunit ribosomal protein L32
MAVPKKKTSRHRKGKRRSHHRLFAPPMATCSRCGKSCRPHAVCDACGHYGGERILVVASETTGAN